MFTPVLNYLKHWPKLPLEHTGRISSIILMTFAALFLTVTQQLQIAFSFCSRHVFPHICVFVYGLLHTFRVGSVYVTLAVTFERFHAIICPLRHFKWKKFMLPFCIFFAVVYNIPKYFELKIVVSNYIFKST